MRLFEDLHSLVDLVRRAFSRAEGASLCVHFAQLVHVVGRSACHGVDFTQVVVQFVEADLLKECILVLGYHVCPVRRSTSAISKLRAKRISGVPTYISLLLHLVVSMHFLTSYDPAGEHARHGE